MTNRGSSPPTIYINFNDALKAAAETFLVQHPLSTVFLFSAFDLFNRVLDNPEAYGFEPTDVDRAGGGIWIDRIHPTSKKHGIFADAVVEFLKTQSITACT